MNLFPEYKIFDLIIDNFPIEYINIIVDIIDFYQKNPNTKESLDKKISESFKKYGYEYKNFNRIKSIINKYIDTISK